MNGSILAAVLGAGGFGAIVVAFITGLFSKRKLGAEATEIITKAAAGVVTNLHAEIERQSRVNAQLVADHERRVTDLIKSHEDEIEDVRRVLQLHVAWDAIAIAKMAEFNIELPPAPPLLPPHREHGRRPRPTE